MEDEDESEENTICKVVLLGESGVGKTSIISRYVHDKFSDTLMCTTGASFASKKIVLEGNNIKFKLWDTAGQERFRSLTRIFYQNASVAILVYDITRVDSFEKIKTFWVKEIKENAPSDIILALAGNKSDNYENEKVSIKEGQDLAKEINAIFMSTSAKLSHGVEELFQTIGKKFINPQKKMNELKNMSDKSFIRKEEEFRKKVKLKKQEEKEKRKKFC
jgi:small GTP-binding protein